MQMTAMPKWSERLQRIPSYLFAGLEAKAETMRAAGMDVIDLGIGDPDLPAPDFFIESIRRHLVDSDAHLYPASAGDAAVRRIIAHWMKVRFNVEVDPASQVCVLIGAKEGIANLARAFVNPGDVVAVPDPAYPVYANGAAILNDGVTAPFPLREERGMLPDFSEITDDTRLLYLNYPNNPTGAVADAAFFERLADWARAHPHCLVAHDNAYSELTFGGYQAPAMTSHWQGGIEFFSLSKIINATGFRIGWAIGHPDVISALIKVKTQLDSGAPVFIQRAMAETLKLYDTPGVVPTVVRQFLAVYGARRTLMENGLRKLGLSFIASPATFYIWAKTPVGFDDVSFTNAALEWGVIIAPGRGFGARGIGNVRFALTQPTERISDALDRLARI